MARQWIRDSRLQTGDWIAIGSCLGGLGALWAALDWGHQFLWEWAQELYVDQDTFATLLEVIPAVVVAVAIFTAGTLFVIAELISSTLGSRAVLNLLTSDVARAGVIIGMMLLVASLAGATAADLPDDPVPMPLLWSSFAVALAVATAVYAGLAMRMLVAVVWTFVDPVAYSRYLARPVADTDTEKAVEDLYKRVRALRQWLRTAAGCGESRDLQFALLGLERLLLQYRVAVVDRPHLRTLAPSEYQTSRLGERWDGSTNGTTGRPPRLQGWFGNEVGRALVRGLEVGMRGQLLRRDADRIVETMAMCISIAGKGAGTHRPDSPLAEGPLLAEEAGFLLDRLAEAGVFCQQFRDPVWTDWFLGPAARLAHFEQAFERTGSTSLPPQLTPDPQGSEAPVEGHYLLASRALVGWCLVQQALEQCDSPRAGEKLLGDAAHRALETEQVWKDALEIARNPDIQPAWLPDQVTGHLDRNTEPNGAWLAYVQQIRREIRDSPAAPGTASAAGRPG